MIIIIKYILFALSDEVHVWESIFDELWVNKPTLQMFIFVLLFTKEGVLRLTHKGLFKNRDKNCKKCTSFSFESHSLGFSLTFL